MTINGTSGNDNLTGTSGDDTFDMSQGGDDIVHGGDGQDTFLYGATLTANDQIDGGGNNDTVILDGDYSAGVSFKATTMVNVENLTVTAGHTYFLTLADATLAFGADMTVDATALGAGNFLHLNAAKVSSGVLTLEGGAGNDIITGGQHGNNFVLSMGGNDNVLGGAGQDQFTMGGALTFADRIDGGGDASQDILELDGDYSAGVTFSATTMVNVNNINLDAGHSYKLIISDATFASGSFADINGLSLGAGDKLTFDGSHETDARLQILGGAGADVLTGGAQSDIIDGGGGADVIKGGAGDDFIDFDITQASAKIDGGDGSDTLQLFSGFAGGYTFKTTQLTSIEDIALANGYSYKLTAQDANVAAGQVMRVDGSQLTGTNTVAFYATHELDGTYSFFGGAGNDIFEGGAQADSFNLTTGGNDYIKGGGGDDVVFMGGTLTADDHLDGGTGYNTVFLDGDYFAGTGIAFKGATMTNIQEIDFTVGHSYRFTTADQTVAAGQNLLVAGTNLGSSDRLLFNASHETDGTVTLDGGAAADILVGGAGNDTLYGGLGADKLTGGAGSDTFVYNTAAESSSTSRDTITDLDGAVDKFDVSGVISAVDAAITTGSLSSSSFDADLTADVNASKLGAGHVVVFTASAGTLTGDTFLIIDQNGTAGYQANDDIVIQLTGATHLSDLSASSFV
jgi:Ca2+-binding RTX toxin-like protein